MSATVSSATAGAQGFDTDQALTAASAKALVATGFRFGVRYLSRTSPQNPGDLSATEVQAILGAGLALMAVQHVSPKGWVPSTALGAAYGTAAAQNAVECVLPPGTSIWLDLEECAPYATSADAIDYVNTWAGVVAGGGYLPGLYEGANQPISGDDLYWRLRVTSYWKSASTVPAIPYRGHCMVQALAPSPVAGIAVDRNVVMADGFGGLPKWVVAAG